MIKIAGKYNLPENYLRDLATEQEATLSFGAEGQAGMGQRRLEGSRSEFPEKASAVCEKVKFILEGIILRASDL